MHAMEMGYSRSLHQQSLKQQKVKANMYSTILYVTLHQSVVHTHYIYISPEAHSKGDITYIHIGVV